MPTVLALAADVGRSNTRQKISSAAQAPPARMTVPSPPGSSYSRPSARVKQQREDACGDEEDRRLDERERAEGADGVAR